MQKSEEKTAKEQIEEIRQKLLKNDDVFIIDENGDLKKCTEKKNLLCDKCSEPIPCSNYEDGSFVKCPNCEYIQYVSSVKHVVSYWEWKVVDEIGNDILNYNGNCRVFHNKNLADEYIGFCKMSGKWKSEKRGHIIL